MARWHTCNVLQPGVDARRLWQFDGRAFGLHREQTFRASDPLPTSAVAKSWSSLWQPRLNIAWLPPESVFIRAAQFPPGSPEETRAMVEFQLEKLSPIPVTQAVWTFHTLPAPDLPATLAGPGEGRMQTIVVTIASRSVVEDFLGRLEEQGYMADRLEVPELDQLQATKANEDGAWIYPTGGGGALVAWWYGGVLRNIAGVTLPAGAETIGGLRDQLMQMAWGGELEGWLTSPPTWHLVADESAARQWEPPLRTALEQPIEIIPPLSAAELAARTARRSAQSDSSLNLLPAEFAERYRQKFQDRLWLRGLGAVLALYGIGCIIYFIAVGFLSYQCSGVEKTVRQQTKEYNKALEVKARYQVLKQRQALKYAALDCWEKTAEYLPEGLTLDSLAFSDGSKLTLSGTAAAQQERSVIEFCDKLGKASQNGQPLFSRKGGVISPQISALPGNAQLRWSFGLDLEGGERL